MKETFDLVEYYETPEWVEALCRAMASSIEWKIDGQVDWYYLRADQNELGMDVINVSPSLVEIEEAGPRDGVLAFPRVFRFEVLEAQKVFDEVSSVIVDVENDDQPIVSITGKYQGRDVMVFFYIRPCPDET
jgi:hypothetical protein